MQQRSLGPPDAGAGQFADRDDEPVWQAVTNAIGLEHAPYDGDVFEGGAAAHFFRLKKGSKLGDKAETDDMPGSVFTFAGARKSVGLVKAVEAVRHAHFYEEPVVIVQQVWTSRAVFGEDREIPNRWSNRGFKD